jgi:MSHA pilin protein MshC
LKWLEVTSHSPNPRSNQGFTLTELVVSIVVAGILAATVVPRFTGENGFEGRGFRDQTAAALRYAQKSAIASRRLVCVDFELDRVTARIATNFVDTACSSTRLADPSGKLDSSRITSYLEVIASSGSRFSTAGTTFAIPGALTFNAAGQPNAGVSIAVSGLPASLAIAVEAETGYVH